MQCQITYQQVPDGVLLPLQSRPGGWIVRGHVMMQSCPVLIWHAFRKTDSLQFTNIKACMNAKEMSIKRCAWWCSTHPNNAVVGASKFPLSNQHPSYSYWYSHLSPYSYPYSMTCSYMWCRSCWRSYIRGWRSSSRSSSWKRSDCESNRWRSWSRMIQSQSHSSHAHHSHFLSHSYLHYGQCSRYS